MRCYGMIAVFVLGIFLDVNLRSVSAQSPRQICNRRRIKIAQRFYSMPELTAQSSNMPGTIYFRRDNTPIVNIITTTSTAERPRDSRSSSGIIDAFGNELYWPGSGSVVAYLAKTRKYYNVSPQISNPKLVLTFDRRAIIVIDPRNGAAYLFNSHRQDIIDTVIHLKSLTQLGTDIVSIAIHPLDGTIILARYVHGRGYIYTLKKFSVDPCIPAKDKETFKNKWRATIDDILVTHRNNTIYQYYCDATNPQCIDASKLKKYIDEKFSQILVSHNNIIKKLIETNKMLEQSISGTISNGEKCADVDNIREISKLQQSVSDKNEALNNAGKTLDSLIAGTDRVIPFFNSSIMESTITANKIDEYSRRNYECVLKNDMKEFKQNMTAVETQVEYLLSGLEMVKNTMVSRTQANELSPNEQENIDSVFGTNIDESNTDYDELDGNQPAVSQDNPFEILEHIDVRFGGSDD